jgi:hypothetical protein
MFHSTPRALPVVRLTNANPAFHHVNNNVVAIVEIARKILVQQ